MTKYLFLNLADKGRTIEVSMSPELARRLSIEETFVVNKDSVADMWHLNSIINYIVNELRDSNVHIDVNRVVVS